MHGLVCSFAVGILCDDCISPTVCTESVNSMHFFLQKYAATLRKVHSPIPMANKVMESKNGGNTILNDLSMSKVQQCLDAI